MRRRLAIPCGLGAILLAALVGGCAKKLPPPSPDRFPPRLERIVTRTRTQIEIEFDEPVEPAETAPDSLVLTGPDGTRLAVRGVSRGRGDSRLLVWTPALGPGVHEIRGRAVDRDGNAIRFRGRFKASERSDTIAPRVASLDPRPGADRIRVSPRLTVRFSEPVDTTAGVPWFFVPARLDSLFRRAWDKDWQSFGVGYRDSLEAGLTAHFVVPTGWRDLEGNLARSAAVTYFSTDSSPDLALVAGRVSGADSVLRGGLVYVEAEGTVAAAAVEPSGRFVLKVRPGSYRAFAVADTSGDGAADLSSPVLPFTAPAESLSLLLGPADQPLRLDAYRR
ncbi:MAG: Ig-like domain-containing protein [bacterium]